VYQKGFSGVLLSGTSIEIKLSTAFKQSSDDLLANTNHHIYITSTWLICRDVHSLSPSNVPLKS